MADAAKPGSPPPVTAHAPPKELPLQAQTQKYQGRPKRTPDDQAEYFYNIRSTHIVFFVSSLALLASVVGMMYQDWDRTWKRYQGTFASMDLARVGRGNRIDIGDTRACRPFRLRRVEGGLGASCDVARRGMGPDVP